MIETVIVLGTMVVASGIGALLGKIFGMALKEIITVPDTQQENDDATD